MNEAAFNEWWEKEREEKSGSPRRPTRGEIWQYFHREFPREAVEKFIKHIYYEGRKHKDEHLWNFVDVSSEINALERLLNGGEAAIECNLCNDTGWQDFIPREGLRIACKCDESGENAKRVFRLSPSAQHARGAPKYL